MVTIIRALLCPRPLPYKPLPQCYKQWALDFCCIWEEVVGTISAPIQTAFLTADFTPSNTPDLPLADRGASFI